MRLYDLLQSYSSSDRDMAIYVQGLSRDSEAIYATIDYLDRIDHPGNTQLEFFLSSYSAAKFLTAIDQGFNYQNLDTISREEWQYAVTYAPSSHQLGYSNFLIPIELSTLGYSLMTYIAFHDPKIYESAYLKWMEKEKPTPPHPDQKQRWRGMAIDGLIDHVKRSREAYERFDREINLP